MAASDFGWCYGELVPDQPFPKAAFSELLGRLPAYGRLAWRLARDPLVSKARRAALVAAAGYLASPIDAVPGFIPVLGQLDDMAVVLGALRLALDGIDPERRRAHLAAVGLSDADLGSDLATLRVTGAWTLRIGARAGGRAAAIGARAGGRAAVFGARTALTGLGAASEVARRAGRAAGREIGRRRKPSSRPPT